jgi:type I site-specific restriction endonuclease
LQFSGKINKGIRDTIRNEAEMFLAFNNGIAATADYVELDESGRNITKIRNLQIVNGGQTTASIYFTNKENNLNILVNHLILSTGIDVPGMNSIMILGEINSPSLGLQILGRAMRGPKNGGNKENTIYLTNQNYNRLSEFKLLETNVLN